MFNIADYPDFSGLYDFVKKYGNGITIMEEEDVLEAADNQEMMEQADFIYVTNIDHSMSIAIQNYLADSSNATPFEFFINKSTNEFNELRKMDNLNSTYINDASFIGGIMTLTKNQEIKDEILNSYNDFFKDIRKNIYPFMFNGNEDDLCNSYYNHLDSHFYINGNQVYTIEDIEQEICEYISNPDNKLNLLLTEHIINSLKENPSIKDEVENLIEKIENNDFGNDKKNKIKIK